MFSCIVDIKSNCLIYSAASSTETFSYSANSEINELSSKGFPLSIVENADFGDIKIPFKLGDSLFLYSDAMTENYVTEEHMLGVDGLKKIVKKELQNNRDTGFEVIDNKQFLKRILKQFHRQTCAPLQDDLTAVIFSRVKNSQVEEKCSVKEENVKMNQAIGR
jgi:serine phosphatase RsbU (regulator of sigma subunit)